ncbi:MAG: hypothetical protein EOO43_03045, partial [Flavobacterium sp.]
MEEIDWKFIEDTPITNSTKEFYSIINNLIHKHTPLYGAKSKYPFWYDNDTKKLISKKEKARQKWKSSNNTNDYESFSSLRRECKAKIKACHNSYISNLQSNIKTNIKLFWAYTKSKRKTNSYPKQFQYNDSKSSNSKDICEMFAKFFKSTYPNQSSDQSINTAATTITQPIVNPILITQGSVEKIINKIDLNKNGGPDGIPNIFLRMTSKQISKPLSMLFNKSICERVYPDEFKSSFITPIFKKGDETKVKNYRPVCMSNSISMIFEKVVHCYLLATLLQKITHKQHGFTISKSTNTNLTEYVSFIADALDEGLDVILKNMFGIP